MIRGSIATPLREFTWKFSFNSWTFEYSQNYANPMHHALYTRLMIGYTSIPKQGVTNRIPGNIHKAIFRQGYAGS